MTTPNSTTERGVTDLEVRTALAVFNNPNNETGTQAMRHALEAFARSRQADSQAIDEPRWVQFSEKMPPQDRALDNPEVKATRRVLVTNNLSARDRMGRMSHVWFAIPIKSTEGVVAYDEADRKIRCLTHWLDAEPPLARPVVRVSENNGGDYDMKRGQT